MKMKTPVSRRFAPVATLAMALLVSACGDDPDKLVSSAQDYLNRQDAPAAIIQLRGALKLDPKFKEASLNLANALGLAGETEQSLAVLDAALQQHPDKAFAFSVCSFGFPVQRALTLDGQGALTALYPEFRQTRSQDLPEAFQDAGQFYWGRSEAWLRGEVLYSSASLPVILPRHLVQDIDTLQDWKRAEYLYAALKAGGELQ